MVNHAMEDLQPRILYIFPNIAFYVTMCENGRKERKDSDDKGNNTECKLREIEEQWQFRLARQRECDRYEL